MGRAIIPDGLGEESFCNTAASATKAELAQYTDGMLNSLLKLMVGSETKTLRQLLRLAKAETGRILGETELSAAENGRNRHLAHCQKSD